MLICVNVRFFQPCQNAYGPSQATPVNAPADNQRPIHNVCTPVDTAAQEAFRTLVNPPSGANTPGIPEDQRWIQENLSHAQKPVTWQDKVRMQQAQQQTQAQQQMQQQQALMQQQAINAQIEAANAQRSYAQLQAQLLERQQAELMRNRPKAEVKDADGQKTELWTKLDYGFMLNDSEINQLFHTLDLQKYGSNENVDKIQAEMLREYVAEKLAENMIANADRDEEGNVMLQGVPVREEDAMYFARQDIKHFQDTDMHLRPDQILAMKDTRHADANANTAYGYLSNTYQPPQREVLHLPGIRNYKFPNRYDLADSSYPDATKNQQIYVRHIVGEVRKYKMGYADFLLRFPPGAIWDLKGQAGIPKAVSGKPMEWAIYQGQLVHDGYLANNVFGHAAAASGMSLQETLDKTNDFYWTTHQGQQDQPEDRAAIISGWWEYYTGNPWSQGLKAPLDYWLIWRNNRQYYQQLRDSFLKQPEIQYILEKSKKIVM